MTAKGRPAGARHRPPAAVLWAVLAAVALAWAVAGADPGLPWEQPQLYAALPIDSGAVPLQSRGLLADDPSGASSAADTVRAEEHRWCGAGGGRRPGPTPTPAADSRPGIVTLSRTGAADGARVGASTAQAPTPKGNPDAAKYFAAPPCGRTLCDDPRLVEAYAAALAAGTLEPLLIRYAVNAFTRSDGDGYADLAARTSFQDGVLNAAYGPGRLSWAGSLRLRNSTALFLKQVLQTCPASWVGDGICDTDCEFAANGWDGGDCAHKHPEAAVCDVRYASGNGLCEPECNTAASGWDGGDCCASATSTDCRNPKSPNRSWMTGDELKETFAEDGVSRFNFFIATPPTEARSALGYGAFPWDDADSSIASAFNAPDNRYAGAVIRDTAWGNIGGFVGMTAVHEVGHSLGLWHTFRGVDELDTDFCSDACSEAKVGADGWRAGDLCPDTRATPVNYQCKEPGRDTCDSPAKRRCRDCAANVYDSTPVHNYMSYAPDSCMSEFSRHQLARVRCYLDAFYPTNAPDTARYPSQLVLAPSVVSVIPGVVSVTWHPPLRAGTGGLKGYHVLRDPPFASGTTLTVAGNNLTDTEVQTSTKYTYSVRPFAEAGPAASFGPTLTVTASPCEKGHGLDKAGACRPCAAGSYAGAGHVCSPAPAGSFVALALASYPAPCPAGSFAAAPGAAACTPCPAGTSTAAPGAAAASVCVTCSVIPPAPPCPAAQAAAAAPPPAASSSSLLVGAAVGCSVGAAAGLLLAALAVRARRRRAAAAAAAADGDPSGVRSISALQAAAAMLAAQPRAAPAAASPARALLAKGGYQAVLTETPTDSPSASPNVSLRRPAPGQRLLPPPAGPAPASPERRAADSDTEFSYSDAEGCANSGNPRAAAAVPHAKLAGHRQTLTVSPALAREFARVPPGAPSPRRTSAAAAPAYPLSSSSSSSSGAGSPPFGVATAFSPPSASVPPDGDVLRGPPGAGAEEAGAWHGSLASLGRVELDLNSSFGSAAPTDRPRPVRGPSFRARKARPGPPPPLPQVPASPLGDAPPDEWPRPAAAPDPLSALLARVVVPSVAPPSALALAQLRALEGRPPPASNAP